MSEIDLMARSSGEIMHLKKANCRNCYKCVRECPVKAISITSDQAKIENSLCIYCGRCYMVCPQDARNLLGDLDRVKLMVKNGEKVYISLSSGFSTYFDTKSLKVMGGVLKELGAYRVEETAIGGTRVIEEYQKIIGEHSRENLISSVCPATNYLIQKYYPRMAEWLIPVETPLEAHARMMRAAYGQDIRVVGVGPCIAYQQLAAETEGGKLIDAYINYEELEAWMKEAGVIIGTRKDEETNPGSNYRGRYLEEVGGLQRALSNDIKYQYKLWEVTGGARVKEMMGGMNNDKFSGYIVNVAACWNNCLGGPLVRLAGKDTFESKDRWLSSFKENQERTGDNPSERAEVDIRKEYQAIYHEVLTPDPEQVNYFLSLVGRDKKEKQLNCSGCGYPTCVAKAVAVCRGMADPYMCIPNSRDKAEAQSNLLFDHSPSGVVIMDANLGIVDINPVAQEILGLEAKEAEGRDIRDFISADFMDHAMLKELDAVRDTVNCKAIGKLLRVTFFKVKGHRLEILVMDDRTQEAEKFTRTRELKEQTLEVTQQVVEKQMRIAQEIASLLGETTAETKLALNKIKALLSAENEDRW